MATSSSRRVAVFAALHTHYLTNNNNTAYVIPQQDFALISYAPIICVVTVLMLGGILIGVFVLMRQKQKRIQEATSLSNLPWIETLEIFAVTNTAGASSIYLPRPTVTPPGPPPAYDIVVKDPNTQSQHEKSAAAARQIVVKEAAEGKNQEEEEGLPTYEAAVQMEHEDANSTPPKPY